MAQHKLADKAADYWVTEPEHHQSHSILGFWFYLMSDCLIFASLFVVYAVLSKAFAAGPSGKSLFDLKLVAMNTTLLLFSSISYGFVLVNAQKGHKHNVVIWLVVTALLGLGFLTLELHEFKELIVHGATPIRSAFLSAFFTLVGTHGMHVAVGVLWILVTVSQVMRWGLNETVYRRLICLSLFWHFLDLIWVGVFSLVYLTAML